MTTYTVAHKVGIILFSHSSFYSYLFKTDEDTLSIKNKSQCHNHFMRRSTNIFFSNFMCHQPKQSFLLNVTPLLNTAVYWILYGVYNWNILYISANTVIYCCFAINQSLYIISQWVIFLMYQNETLNNYVVINQAAVSFTQSHSGSRGKLSWFCFFLFWCSFVSCVT